MATTTSPQPDTRAHAERIVQGPSFGVRAALIGGVSLGVIVLALLLPSWPAGPDMGSTHYMGLLAANQPWNLLLFMAVPVVLAETIAITELAILFSGDAHPRIHRVNRWAGIIAGLYFLGVFAYLLKEAVFPLSMNGGWRGPADLIAVGFYLAGVIPLFGMALLETRVLGADLDARTRLQWHATFVGVFLVVAHVAMIFGMLDPSVLGWSPSHSMPDGSSMSGMVH